MKKILLFACAALVALASCSKDPEKTPPAPGGKVDFVLGVGADSRYNMDRGGLGNVDKEKYSMRYILEVYREADDSFLGRYERYSDIAEEGVSTGTVFNLSLDMDEYRFVMWGDFVSKVEASGDAPDETVNAADATDNFYNTKLGLRNVSADITKYADEALYPVEEGGRMLRDAYCASKIVNLFESKMDVLQLKRPFTRVEINNNIDLPVEIGDQVNKESFTAPTTVTLKYTDGIYTGYDVYAQDVIASSLIAGSVSFTVKVSEEPNYFKLSNGWHYVQEPIAFDYVFAPAEQPATDPEEGPIMGKISLAVNIFDQNGSEIGADYNITRAWTDQELRVNQRFICRGVFAGVPDVVRNYLGI